MISGWNRAAGTHFGLGALLTLAALALGAAASPLHAQEAGRPPVRKVLLIGIDGVRPDVLRQVPTPNLDALIAEGAFSERAQAALPTVSGPGWTSMLTGVWKEKHGIVSNSFPFPGNGLARYPDFLTRIERVRPELRTFAVADWPALVRAAEGRPVIGDSLDVKLALNGDSLGWAEADERSVAAAVEELRTHDPDAAFVYLGNPDEVSHHTGSIEDEYRAAIARADRHVGRLVAAIQARPRYPEEDWLILVSTDHGRLADGSHGGATPEERTIFFLASGPSAAVGTLGGEPRIVDVAATALAHLRIPVEPGSELDGRAVGLR